MRHRLLGRRPRGRSDAQWHFRTRGAIAFRGAREQGQAQTQPAAAVLGIEYASASVKAANAPFEPPMYPK